jgi:hypothetical protein
MNEPQKLPTRVSDQEIDGRLNALAMQRDSAHNTVVLQAGEIAALRHRIQELEQIIASQAPKPDQPA